MIYCGRGIGMENKFDKTKIGIDAFKKFTEQFKANDIYGQIIIEELLKVILEKDDQNEKTK